MASEPQCHWRWATDTAIKFDICLYDPQVDSQISRVITETGAWNGFKRDVLQDALPLVMSRADPAIISGGDSGSSALRRSVFLDIGSNVGFYALLAAMRGYDAVAIDPLVTAASRLAQSAAHNHVSTVTGGVTRLQAWAAARASRVAAASQGVTPARGSLLILRNAASDVYEPVEVTEVVDNPGASYVQEGSEPPSPPTLSSIAWALPLDHLVDLGALDPREVQAIKMSAEGWDSRALAGMRRIIDEGRPPFILMVFNEHHVRQHGCDPLAVMRGLAHAGYRLYDYGLYRDTDEEMHTAMEAWGGRSVELVWVERSTRF